MPFGRRIQIDNLTLGFNSLGQLYVKNIGPLLDNIYLTLDSNGKATIKDLSIDSTKLADSSITLSKLGFKSIYLEGEATGSGTSVQFTNTTVSNGIYLLIIDTATTYYRVSLFINGDTTGSNYESISFVVDENGTATDYDNTYATIATDRATAILYVSEDGYARAYSIG